jgi:hypothetical protein
MSPEEIADVMQETMVRLSALERTIADAQTHPKDRLDAEKELKGVIESIEKKRPLWRAELPATLYGKLEELDRVVERIRTKGPSVVVLSDDASTSINVLVDSDVDPQTLAAFFAELSAIYSDLSDGDELVIREGKIPVAKGVLV